MEKFEDIAASTAVVILAVGFMGSLIFLIIRIGLSIGCSV